MFTAMRVTLQHERNRTIMETLGETGSRPEAMPITCRHALEWTTVNGASLIGLDHRVGSLTPGKQADVILLRAGDLNMFPVRDPIGSIVMQGGVANVDTVLIAGRVMKQGGQLLYGSLPEKMAHLQRSGKQSAGRFQRTAGSAAQASAVTSGGRGTSRSAVRCHWISRSSVESSPQRQARRRSRQPRR